MRAQLDHVTFEVVQAPAGRPPAEWKELFAVLQKDTGQQ